MSSCRACHWRIRGVALLMIIGSLLLLGGQLPWVVFGGILDTKLNGGGWWGVGAGLAVSLVVAVLVVLRMRRAIRSRMNLSVFSTISISVTALLLAGAAGCESAKPGFFSSLFGPPPVELAESYVVKPDGPVFDHALFDGVLREFVSAEGGWVDYQGLAAAPGKLNEYIAALGDAPFDAMGRNQKLALLINAYNAFTLRLILDHYPLASIKDIRSSERWDAVRWSLGGHVWSLNQIEHEQIRPHFIEPRIHFALVCAAVGCPPLRNEAYQADNLEMQLDTQMRYAHASKRWLVFAATGNAVSLTSLYNWYGADFEQDGGSVIAFAARYSPVLARALEGEVKPRVRFLDYDWSLNSRENSP